jgi:dsDNA-binding SOS-regulon protein
LALLVLDRVEPGEEITDKMVDLAATLAGVLPEQIPVQEAVEELGLIPLAEAEDQESL